MKKCCFSSGFLAMGKTIRGPGSMVYGWNESRRNLPIVTVDLWKVCSRICDISVPLMGNISPLVVMKAKQMMCPKLLRVWFSTKIIVMCSREAGHLRNGC